MNSNIDSVNRPATLDRDEVLLSHRCGDACMHCGFEPPHEERLEYQVDFMQHARRMDLLDAVKLRRGGEHLPRVERFSSAFIVEQAAHRHFMLLEATQARLKGYFTLAEFDVILSCECSLVWLWDTYMSVATMVADDQGVDSIDELAEDDPLRVLLNKLLALTPLENAAVVDACERVWRRHDNPML